MNLKLATWATMALALLCAGCSNGNAPASAHGESPMGTQQAPTEPAGGALSPEAFATSGSTPPPEPALADYRALADVGGDEFESYAFASRVQPPLPDDKLLSLFAPGYYGESDQFRKQEIAGQQMPVIRQRLDAIRPLRFFKTSVSYDTPGDLSPYNFDTHGFHINFCGNLGFRFSDKHSTPMVIHIPDKLCSIPVPSVDKARELEGFRSSYHLAWKADLWFRLDGIDPDTQMLTGEVTRMHIDLVRNTAEDLNNHIHGIDNAPVLLNVDLH